MKFDDVIMFRTIKRILDDPVQYAIGLLYCSLVMFAFGMILAYFV